MRYDWHKISREYITGDCSLEELSKKHNISVLTIRKHSAKGRWVEERERYRNDRGTLLTKKAHEMAQKRNNRAEERIDEMLDKLMDGIAEDVENCKGIKERQICLSNIKTAQEVLQSKKSFPKKLSELEAKIKKLSAEADALDKAKDVMEGGLTVEWKNGEWMDEDNSSDAE